MEFAQKLEAACVGTVESGKMTKDLALLIHGSKYVLSFLFKRKYIFFSYALVRTCVVCASKTSKNVLHAICKMTKILDSLHKTWRNHS